MNDHDQSAFEEALRADINAARNQIMMLKDQLREAQTLNETLSYKIDYLTEEVARVTTSREQYERVSIRVATFAESVASVAIKQLQDLQEEIKSAAFSKVPGSVQNVTTSPNDVIPSMDDMVMAGKQFGAGFDSPSASLLPVPKFGNGAAQK